MESIFQTLHTFVRALQEREVQQVALLHAEAIPDDLLVKTFFATDSPLWNFDLFPVYIFRRVEMYTAMSGKTSSLTIMSHLPPL